MPGTKNLLTVFFLLPLASLPTANNYKPGNCGGDANGSINAAQGIMLTSKSRAIKTRLDKVEKLSITNKVSLHNLIICGDNLKGF